MGSARTRAALAVNQELIGLYWRIGREILVRQEHEGWGGRVVERLASDLREAFPEMKGFSYTNLKYMRQFASYWPDGQIGPLPVGQLPWGHIRCLLDKLDDPAARMWYVQSAVEHAWSRKLLNALMSVNASRVSASRSRSRRSIKVFRLEETILVLHRGATMDPCLHDLPAYPSRRIERWQRRWTEWRPSSSLSNRLLRSYMTLRSAGPRRCSPNAKRTLRALSA